MPYPSPSQESRSPSSCFGIEAAAIAFALGAPLTAILLVVVLSAPSPHLTALVVTSVVTALVFGAIAKPVMERRKRETSRPA